MINSVTPFQLNVQGTQLEAKAAFKSNPTSTKTNFAETLKKSIEQINQSQIESDKRTEALAKGENVELHDVMISAQKASVTLLTTVEVRNKAIEAYQEMMRMQV